MQQGNQQHHALRAVHNTEPLSQIRVHGTLLPFFSKAVLPLQAHKLKQRLPA